MKLQKQLLGLFGIFAVIVAALSIWQIPQIKINNNILALFPEQYQDTATLEAKQHALDMYSDFASKRVLFLVGHPKLEDARNAALSFSRSLDQDIFAKVAIESEADAISELADIYDNHAPFLLSPQNKAAIQEDPEQVVQSTIRSLFTNPGFLSGQSFSLDPFSFSSDFLQKNIDDTAGELNVVDGFIQTSNPNWTWILIRSELSESAFSLKLQKKLKSELAESKKKLSAEYPASKIVHSGAVFFALSGAEQAHEEVSTVGLGSVLGIILLLLVVFLSFRVLVFSLFPTFIGILAGLLVCNAIFGQVHTIALVFGASLIGVSIDYTFHFLSKRQDMATEWQSERGIKKLRWGLGLGAFTSASAYTSFAFSGFPGFQQIAVFSATGLVAACITVATLFPSLFSDCARPNVIASFFVNLLSRYDKVYPKSFIFFTPLLLLAIVISFFGIRELSFDDDIRSMQNPSPAVLEQQQYFDAINGQNIARQFFLVSAPSKQALLEKLEKLTPDLNNLTNGFYSISNWVPSKKRQRQNQKLIRKALLNGGSLDTFFDGLPISSELKSSFTARLESKKPDLLEFDEAFEPLSAVIEQPLAFSLKGKHYAYISFRSPVDEERLESWAAYQQGVYWVDQVKQTNELLSTYRLQSIRILLFAFVLVYSILLFRYSWLRAMLVITPPLFACTLTVACFAFAGLPLSLFNVMALVLVLGIGIDYTIFVRETSPESAVTLFAIALSTLTTILSFGLLALSETEAISSFGKTVFIGISLCFFLSPIAKLQLRTNRSSNTQVN